MSVTEGGLGSDREILRSEDARLLTGQGKFTDDLTADGQLYAAFLRSPVAHADIRAIGTGAAKSMPGVRGVFTGADLVAAGIGPLPCLAQIEGRDGRNLIHPPRHALAVGRARHVGEPVAVVVADTYAQARDAAEAIGLDYDALPAAVDVEKAVEPGAPQVWDDVPNNVAVEWETGDRAAVDKAIAAAHHVTRLHLLNNRLAACAMEPRAASASYDPDAGRYTLVSCSQGVGVMHMMLTKSVFKVPAEKMRVLTYDVGGGFGMKTQPYPEYVAILHAAKALGRPVKWTGDRSESFLADNQGRDTVLDGELALDKDGNILALKVSTLSSLGAYLGSHAPRAPVNNTTACLSSVYRTPAIYLEVKLVHTNTMCIGPYRGAGRPEAIYVVERLVDTAAREMGIDPAELRRRNFIPPSAMPFKTPLGFTYDSGEFETILDKTLELADWKGFPARRDASKAAGKLRGIGLASFLEIAGGVTKEGMGLRIAPDGKVEFLCAVQSNGQGHDTVFAQIAADRLGIPMGRIRIVEGDSDRAPAVGMGSVASRSLFVAGNAVVKAADETLAKGKTVAGHVLEAAEADIEYTNGTFRVAGTDREISLFDLAARATEIGTLPDGSAATLDSDVVYEADGSTWPNGSHVCEVEIDPETGTVAVVGYAGVDDCGVIVNHMIVDGQLHGGIAQGLGQVLSEHVIYDEDGQLLTGSYMDYAVPRATDLPDFKVGAHVVPCTTNPLGVKGAGESGTIGAIAAGMNAVMDALAKAGVTRFDMPATPSRVWAALQSAR